MVEYDRLGGGSVMVWGRIGSGCKTHLIIIEGNLTAQQNINTVLQPVVMPNIGACVSFACQNILFRISTLLTNCPFMLDVLCWTESPVGEPGLDMLPNALP